MCVLIVEDEVLVAFYVQGVLNEMGHDEVHLLHDLSSAYEWLTRYAPTFAILDVNVGQELVYPLAAALVARQVPVIFSSALSVDKFPPEWRNHPLVPKPLDKATLAGVLQSFGLHKEETRPSPN